MSERKNFSPKQILEFFRLFILLGPYSESEEPVDQKSKKITESNNTLPMRENAVTLVYTSTENGKIARRAMRRTHPSGKQRRG